MRLLLLADMHVGSIRDTEYYYNVMRKIIEKEIINTHTDAVILLGDYFDRLFKVNEEYVSLAINIMSFLIRACIREKTKIRIVYGTESHEMNQYRLFNYHFTSSHVDVKLFTTCTEEELFPGCNVLYIPEEYIDNKHDFYKKTLYSGKKYDYIFGHGVIEEGVSDMMRISKTASDKSEKQVPRFKAGEFSSISKVTAFGHWHIHCDMDNVHYVGSLFRKSFGEEEAKGYAIIEDGVWHFIENEDAYTYKTYEFNNDSTIYTSTSDMLSEIEKIKKENKDIFNGTKTGKIRVIFHTTENTDQTFYDCLKDTIGGDKLFSPLIKEEDTSIIEEAKEELDDEHAFVLDKNMNIPDKIHTFISLKNPDIDLPVKRIDQYIYKPLEF